MIEKKKHFFEFFSYILTLFLFKSSCKCELLNFNHSINFLKPSVYSISSKKFGQYNNLVFRPSIDQTIYFSSRNTGLIKNIRFIPIKNQNSTYYLEFVKNKKKLVLNESEIHSIILYDNISIIEENNLKLKWKIYNIKDRDFIIQNLFSKKFWRTKGFIYLDCAGEINDWHNTNFINASSIDNAIKFKITKLYEELRKNEEYIHIIEK